MSFRFWVFVLVYSEEEGDECVPSNYRIVSDRTSESQCVQHRLSYKVFNQQVKESSAKKVKLFQTYSF